MRVQIIMGLSFIWIVMGIVGGMLEGEFIKQSQVQVIQDMTYFQVLDSQGMIGIPVMGLEFFKQFPNIISFKYDWMTSGFLITRFIMMCISMGIIYGLAQTFIPGLFGAIGNLLRWNR